MEAIPQSGAYTPVFTMKPRGSIKSGTYFERGNLLVAKITPSFENGKQALARDMPQPFGYATTEVIPLRPRDPGHDPRLLFFYLLHPDVRHHVAERMEGSTGRQRVPESVLLDVPIPDIDPSDQKAMADALETVQRAIAAEIALTQATQLLKCAAMRTLFTRGLRGEAQKATEIGMMPENWMVEPLGAHHSVVSGGTPSRANPAYWQGGNVPWVKTGEIDYRIITETEEHITQAGLNDSAAKLLSPGTLMLAMYGQGVTRARVALLGIEAACNQACAAVRPTDDAVDSKYLYHYMTYRYEAIRQMAHGGQQQNLNLNIVGNLLVAFSLDVSEQREITAILDAIDRKIDLCRYKRDVLNDLFKALLHKLMTGEIRVTDLDLSALEHYDAAMAGAGA